MKGIAERSLASVFKASLVPRAHAHRFRHTLATELLSNGASFEDVADILGNSPGDCAQALREVVTCPPGAYRRSDSVGSFRQRLDGWRRDEAGSIASFGLERTRREDGLRVRRSGQTVAIVRLH
jgi:integrase